MRFFAFAALLAIAGCGDPVLDAQREALGDEVAGIPKGPAHRAGQPCLVCHSRTGKVPPFMSIAGTIFQKATNDVPVEGAKVVMTDTTGYVKEASTNCVGSFYVEEAAWTPWFPVRVEISYTSANGELFEAKMKSEIGRDGSCASCHVDPEGERSPGHVFLMDAPEVPDFEVPALSCAEERTHD